MLSALFLTLLYFTLLVVAVRMGISLPSSVRRTQYIAVIVTGISVTLFGIVTILLYVYRSFFITIFVNNDNSGTDKAVYELAEDIWPLVSFYNLNIALFGLLAGISR
jgi:Na+-driven multidrug efflux pump